MRSALHVTVFDLELLDERPGQLIFEATGPKADAFFKDEAGGHRWQRIPPSERRGRVQTSTVTVAILPIPTEVQVRIDKRDIEVRTCRSSGSGGQNVNKTESAVQMTHKPTGLMVRCENERSQNQNRATALSLLRARLWQAEREKTAASRAQNRRAQLGSGERGDKRRTIRVQDGQVHDHITDQRWTLKSYLRGEW